MLSVMTSSSHWILSLKLLLLSSALLSMAVILKFYVPVVAGILLSDVPAVWSSIVFWLKPPYLYLLLNFIIISILASSKLHKDLVDPPPTTVPKPSADSQTDFTVSRAVVSDVLVERSRGANEDFAADVSEDEGKSEHSRVVSDREIDENSETDRRRQLRKEDSMENLLKKTYDKKPSISSKVGNRKAAKAAATPAGTITRWSRMNGHDTLDDAWKAITESDSAPFSRRLDKFDTWELHTKRDEEEEEETAIGRNSSSPPKVTKSETTFVNGQELKLRQSATAGRVRKMASLTEEELNRRVEAFIEKFKEEMRLQREESLKKFEVMVKGIDY